MYRFIDTVSIDVMSITGYHLDEKATRGENRGGRAVEGSEGIGWAAECPLPRRGRVRSSSSCMASSRTALVAGGGSGISEEFRCIVPDLPLGGHSVPMDLDADLTPRGGPDRRRSDGGTRVARRDAGRQRHGWGYLPGSDLRAPRARGRLVLTNCDAYEPSSRRSSGPSTTRLGYSVRGSWTCSRGPAGARRAAALFQDRRLRRMDEATLDAYIGPLDPGRGGET